MTDSSHDVALSGARLKAIAHPLRVRLLSILREDGPSTATRLAERVGQSSGVTSYHLRQLADHGFVAEDASLGTGRDRWWRAVAHRMSLDAPSARASQESAEVYMRSVAAQEAERVDRWLHELPALPEEWDGATDMSSFRLRLTADEARALVAVLRRIGAEQRQDDGSPGPDTAERVFLQFQVMPFIRSDQS